MFQSLCFRRDTVPSYDLLKGMFELRREIFFEQLGWNVEVSDGQEVDVFDRKQDPVYIVSRGRGDEVYGCFRLLPTMGPYMLGEVFPELLRGSKLPRSPEIWEISRLATTPELVGTRLDPQLSLCAVTIGMFRQGFLYAEENGIHEYIFVTSVAVERMLLRSGLKLRRFGDGKAVKVGKVLSVACWLGIDSDNRRVLFPETHHVERAA